GSWCITSGIGGTGLVGVDDWQHFGFWIFDFGLKRRASLVVGFESQETKQKAKDSFLFNPKSKIQNLLSNRQSAILLLALFLLVGRARLLLFFCRFFGRLAPLFELLGSRFGQ